ncbi:MAG TPA: hypothetical protein VFN67_38970, partial [Polyangiales bacterium]|nr:hypothetical protein [Polyangiales bacterium]
YGIQIGFTDTRMLGAVGVGDVVVTAAPETPEGLYVVPLEAAFVGYTPEHCNLLLQVMSRCTAGALGPQALDADRRMPLLRVRVTKEIIRSHQDVVEEQRLAQQRAITQRVQNITAMLGAVRGALDDTEKQMKKKNFEAARSRLDELGRLFEPLDAFVVTTADDESLPDDVLELRARFEQSAHKQREFEDGAFDVVYTALSKPRTAADDDDKVIARTAKQLHITGPFLERIYAEHAEQIEQRMARAQDAVKQAEQKAHDTLMRRCGPLPKGSFQEVQAFLTARAQHFGLRLHMRECLTPRLSPENCWSVVCDFDDVRSLPDTPDDDVQKHSWTFELRNGRVVRHREEALR